VAVVSREKEIKSGRDLSKIVSSPVETRN
jgi:hypothetical protein